MRSRAPLLAGAVLAVLASCRASLPATPAVMKVTMRDYGFELAPPPRSGRVVFQARNDGRLNHELVLVEMGEDFPLTIDQQLHSETRQVFPTRGYLPPRGPGSEGTFAVDLAPGRYALICFVADPDGEQHALKGMNAEFRVR